MLREQLFWKHLQFTHLAARSEFSGNNHFHLVLTVGHPATEVTKVREKGPDSPGITPALVHPVFERRSDTERRLPPPG